MLFSHTPTYTPATRTLANTNSALSLTASSIHQIAYTYAPTAQPKQGLMTSYLNHPQPKKPSPKARTLATYASNTLSETHPQRGYDNKKQKKKNSGNNVYGFLGFGFLGFYW